ncbi:MAG TPA: PaaI family thioesterase [Candidatus Anoxymicrobiaceae bacterium]|jgi:acyl-coenzyme A thioesterase PaaI-like protein
MDAELMVKMVEGACPFAQRSHMRVTRVGEEGYITMILEDDPANYNAFGLVHAGAMCGLVETTGGMAIFNYLDPMEFVILNSVLTIRFTAMPMGELRCSARVTAEEVEVLVDEFRINGKADKAMDLKVLDADGKMVAQAQATFRLMVTPDMFKERFAGMMQPG